MAIFNSYVKLPEGNCPVPRRVWHLKALTAQAEALDLARFITQFSKGQPAALGVKLGKV